MASRLVGISVLALLAVVAAACDDGGAAPVSTGTAGPGAGAVGGSPAGVGGATGVGGVGGAGGTAVTMSQQVPIPTSAGWVGGADNSVGIQGSWYTFADIEDGGASTIAPASFEMAPENQLCVSGDAAQVIGGEFGKYYGAALGLNLNQMEDIDTAYPYDGAAAGVTGFAFTLSELPIGGKLRFTVKVSGSEASYCSPIMAPGYNEFHFTDLTESCWTGAASGGPDASNLEALHWQIVTNDSAGYSYSFCISDLAALTG